MVDYHVDEVMFSFLCDGNVVISCERCAILGTPLLCYEVVTESRYF